MGFHKICIPFLLLFLGGNLPSDKIICETDYEIEVLHPGIALDKPIQKNLVQSKCNGKVENEYYMDVESVVCGDSQCRIDIIRIYWDELGFFNKLKLPEDVELEKAEGAVFTSEDYLKLNTILSDKNSELKDVNKYEVTGSGAGEGIDAFSGATVALGADSYVKGAVWTCYTLWHWANGSTVNSIRNITGDGMTAKGLVNWLESDELERQLFAIQQLTRKKYQDADALKAVLELAAQKNKDLQKHCIQYIEELSEIPYFKSILTLLIMNNHDLSVLTLNSLLEKELRFPDEYIEELGRNVVSRDSYQQIDLYLKILEKQKTVSAETVENCLNLIKHDNFLIARRAYWFLSQQKVSNQQKLLLKTFYENNGGKL